MFMKKCRCGKSEKLFKNDIGAFFIAECCAVAGYDYLGNRKDEKPADEKPADAKPVDEKPVDEKPVDEKPVDEKPIIKRRAKDKSVDKKPIKALQTILDNISRKS